MKIFVNMLTIMRFVLSFFLPLLLVNTSPLPFLIVIICIFLTDTLDGMLARKFKVQTYFGAMMDTLADKVLNIILLLCLLEKYSIFTLLLGGELTIFLVNSVAFFSGKKTKASILGKGKMWLVAFSIIFGYIYLFDGCSYHWVIVSTIVAVISQIITIIHYCIVFIKEKQESSYQINKKVELKTLLFDTEYYVKNKM